MSVASCSICFEELLILPSCSAAELVASSNLEDISSTPCGHVFHTKCITQWVDLHDKHCPQCRKGVSRSELLRLYLGDAGISQRTYGYHANQCLDAEKGKSGTIVANSDEEEAKIILDVVQCQLEEVTCENKVLKERIRITEENLETSIIEISSLEESTSKLRANELTLNQRISTFDDQLNEAFSKLRTKELECDVLKNLKERLENESSQIQRQILDLRKSDQEKETMNRDLTQRNKELKALIVSHEMSPAEPRFQASEPINNSHSMCIYESLEELEENALFTKKRNKRNRFGIWRCIKFFFVILFLLIVILGLLVALPIKIIFSESNQN